jgi:hypothetical protein
MPVGRGKNQFYNTFDEFSAMKRSIIVIKGEDNLCLPRALVTDIANKHFKAKKITECQYKNVLKDKRNFQKLKAIELCNLAKIRVPERGCGIDELKQLQLYLTEFKIVVYKYYENLKGYHTIFEGENSGAEVLNLLYHKNHFNVITSLTGAFVSSYYCETCHKPSNNKDEKQHRCSGSCICCQMSPPCPPMNEIFCKNCNCSFKGPKCFSNHLASTSKKSSLCNSLKSAKIVEKNIKAIVFIFVARSCVHFAKNLCLMTTTVTSKYLRKP